MAEPARVADTAAAGTATMCPASGTRPAQPPPPVWRAPRMPYEWAPLGTVQTDYPPLPPRCRPDRGDPDSDRPAIPDPGPPADRRTAGTRRAHALGIIAATFLQSGIAPTHGGERPQLLVTIDEQSLRERTGSGRLGYGDRIPIEQVRMLACDSQVIPAVLRGKTELLDMGRAMRSFNAATKRAILLRDIGCVFPGCDLPGKWAEFHHIQHWADGGPSDYRNGCLLCRRHHTLIHHGQWTVAMAPDGHPDITPPIAHDLHQRPLRNTLHRPPEFNWPSRIRDRQ